MARQDFSIGSTLVRAKGGISPVWIFVAIGALFLVWFFLHVRSAEKKATTCCWPSGCSGTEPRSWHCARGLSSGWSCRDGTALVGAVLIAAKLPAGRPFALALTTILVIALIGLASAVLIPP